MNIELMENHWIVWLEGLHLLVTIKNFRLEYKDRPTGVSRSSKVTRNLTSIESFKFMH